jgi:hypothetical protein
MTVVILFFSEGDGGCDPVPLKKLMVVKEMVIFEILLILQNFLN